MDKRKKSLLIACSLGSGYIYKHVENKSYFLRIEGPELLKEYMEYKANLIRKATGKKCEVKARNLNGIMMYSLTCNHRYFRVLKKWLYPKGVVNYEYIKYLDSLGIAILYMDIGNTYEHKIDKGYIQMEFQFYCSKKEAEFLIKYFKKTWDIEFRLHKKFDLLYNIRCYKPNSIKLAKLIEPYVPESMKYKIAFLSNI